MRSLVVPAVVLLAAAAGATYYPVTDAMRTKAAQIRAAALAPGNATDVFDRLGVLTDD